MAYTTNIPQPNDNISTSQDQILKNFQFLGDTTGTVPGYYKLPNGLIIQWGNQTFTTSGTKTVNLSTPFLTQVYSVTFSLAFLSSGSIVPVCLDNTVAANPALFKFRVNASPPVLDPGQFYWIAIGI